MLVWAAIIGASIVTLGQVGIWFVEYWNRRLRRQLDEIDKESKPKPRGMFKFRPSEAWLRRAVEKEGDADIHAGPRDTKDS